MVSEHTTPEIDDIDLQIIAALQVDGRASFAELATKIDLSQAAIRLRVNRLLATGVFQIVAVTDPLTIGFKVQAMLGLNVDGDIQLLSDKICALDSVVYVLLTAGRFDMLVEVLCADNDDLLEMMSGLRALDGVSSLEAFTYLQLAKQSYAFGILPDRS